ncbi:hypothetical protein HPP92_001559 [Vanilla planifolia]|uniref:t-SNARE coiled-coil homology domain-containing protein n=1 Tax=Vanilla planifolia TaxID=51239 RepID=A0A835VJS6_VANPL|nr:hypothetical protein HPP92_001559 [Vanilla planifolia]
MNDLLTDSSADKSRSPRERDIELGIPMDSSKSVDYGMEDFFKRVKGVEDFMERLNKNLKKLQEANEETKSVTKASAMRAIKKKMDKEIEEVGKVARAIKVKLEEIDKDNLENRKKPGCEKGTAVDRSRMSMTISLKKKLKDNMTDFQNLRQTIQEEYREVVERRVFTVTGTKPSEEVIDALEEIQERHDVVREIEKKLLDLQQVFMDMAILVEAQGELLDNIESQKKKTITLAIALQVANAVNHVENGMEALQTAKSLQKKSRKCMMIAIFILLIISVIVVLSILKPWK